MSTRKGVAKIWMMREFLEVLLRVEGKRYPGSLFKMKLMKGSWALVQLNSRSSNDVSVAHNYYQ